MKLLLWLAELFLKLWNIATAEGTVPEASGSVLTDCRAIPKSSKALPVSREAVPNTYICISMENVIKNVPYLYKYGIQNGGKEMRNTSTEICDISTKMRCTLLQKCVILPQKCAILLQKCAILPQIV